MQLKKYLAPGLALDVGCAAGFILKGLQDSGWNGIGIEPDLMMAEYGRNQLGLNIIQSTLEEYRPADNFDLIFNDPSNISFF